MPGKGRGGTVQAAEVVLFFEEIFYFLFKYAAKFLQATAPTTSINLCAIWRAFSADP